MTGRVGVFSSGNLTGMRCGGGSGEVISLSCLDLDLRRSTRCGLSTSQIFSRLLDGGLEGAREGSRDEARDAGLEADREAGREVERAAGLEVDRAADLEVDRATGREVDRAASLEVDRAGGREADRAASCEHNSICISIVVTGTWTASISCEAEGGFSALDGGCLGATVFGG